MVGVLIVPRTALSGVYTVVFRKTGEMTEKLSKPTWGLMSNLLSPTVGYDPELSHVLDHRYQVNKILATRVWGRTYLSRDLRRPSQSKCIIYQFKQIPESSDADWIRCLFAKEAALLEDFGTHHQIPQLLACFEDDHGFYVVQEWIEGRSLSHELIPGVPWSDEQAIAFLQEVLDPLAFIHAQGGLHGNIKPETILRRQDGQLVLIDFGSLLQIQQEYVMAHGWEEPTHPSETSYQPKEHRQGMPSPASDVYAIGLIAAQALTGKHPLQFQIDSQSGEVLWQPHYEEGLAPINHGLAEVITWMVRSDLSQRFRSAGEALQALQEVRYVAPNDTRSLLKNPHSGKTIITVTLPAERASNPQFESSEKQDEPTAPTANQPFFLTRLLMSAIASPAVRIGVGGTALTAIVAAIGWSLLNSVDWSHPNHVWGKASKKLQKTQPPTQAGLAKSDSPTRIASIESENLLQTAYDRAQDHDFTAALKALKQITPETSVAAIAQVKVDEYTKKQAIKAQSDLQKAYDRAALREFSHALTYLWQIPEGTTASAIAQKKVVEYSQKEQIRTRLMLQAADDHAQQQDFLAALTALEKIPAGSSLDDIVEQKRSEYTAKLNQQSVQWLQQSKVEAATGQTATAIAVLTKIPIGTPAYAQAREKLAEIVEKSALQIPPTAGHNLNPGTYLREVVSAVALKNAHKDELMVR
jgi:serine/threonine protein kinase